VSSLPTGTVTFLFTDIAGSTRLWQEHPDQMRGVLARHDELVRDAIESRGGHVVKTTGDGFHAVFAEPMSAVDAAVAAQHALVTEEWSLAEHLHVRMGIHTGPAESRDGDYYGTTVNKAARLMSVAHGGQIVVSFVSAELARDALDGGADFLDLGEHRLRDFGQRERVFQVTHPALRSQFPALNSVGVVRGNLPTQLSSFVGRDDEVATLVVALSEARLVTLTGVGGVGKTRLAIETAMAARADFVDGAWFCELAAAPDGAALVEVVAGAVEAPARPGVSLTDSVIEFLRTREALIVLDNCEHLIDEAGKLAASILRDCTGVRILATSREGLAVAGEHVWPLRSLGLPNAESSLERVADSPSVRLFVDRAQAARPGFALQAGSEEAVAEICRRLDGIPLAIELAAARVVAMNPGEIRDRLDERFRLLTGGRRSGVDRHQTLRAAVDWSYSLLSDLERTVFDRLGVFSGVFDLAAATEVVRSKEVAAWDVVDTIGSLVAKSTLSSDHATEGGTRYRMLETVRQYARDRLDERGEADERRRRHAAYYADRSEEAGRGLRGPDELSWRQRVASDLDNIRAAVTWSLDSADAGDQELALRIVAAFAGEANTSASSFGVGLWAERAMPAALETTKPGLRADVLAATGWSALVRGDLESARELAFAALADGPSPDMSAPAIAYVLLGYLEIVHDRADAAIEVTAKGCDAVAALPGDHLYDLVTVAASHAAFLAFGSRAEGEVEGEDVLRMARDLGNPSVLANALTVRVISTWVEQPDLAEPWLDEALELVRNGASGVMYGIMLAIRAQLFLQHEDLPAARSAIRQAVAFVRDTGDVPQLVNVFEYAIPILVESELSVLASMLSGFVLDGPLVSLRSMPTAVLPRRDAALERARRELGEERALVERAHGATLSATEAIAQALDALDALPSQM
jgi:predicted ATPase/class 3 adenylate cyclase